MRLKMAKKERKVKGLAFTFWPIFYYFFLELLLRRA